MYVCSMLRNWLSIFNINRPIVAAGYDVLLVCVVVPYVIDWIISSMIVPVVSIVVCRVVCCSVFWQSMNG